MWFPCRRLRGGASIIVLRPQRRRRSGLQWGQNPYRSNQIVRDIGTRRGGKSRAQQRGIRKAYRADFSTRKFSMTNVSISLVLKVWKALAGVLTTGSPLRLNEVLRITGTPVAWPNRWISL